MRTTNGLALVAGEQLLERDHQQEQHRQDHQRRPIEGEGGADQAEDDRHLDDHSDSAPPQAGVSGACDRRSVDDGHAPMVPGRGRDHQ